jgi:hypothetical protein
VADRIEVVREGDEGDSVSRVQHALELIGFDPGGVTGSFDGPTREAVLSFQRVQGLAADGMVGPITRQRIDLLVAGLSRPPLVSRPASPRRSLPPNPDFICQPPPLPGATSVAFAPPQSQRLVDMGIDVIPDTGQSCQGPGPFPPGFDPTLLINYGEIVDAFSHIPYPGIWQPLGRPDPFPPDAYYDQFFRTIADPFPVVVEQSGLSTPVCGGETGNTNGSMINLCDCADRTVVMHEMGHVLDRRGIREQISPLYYGPAQVPGGAGTNQPTLNAIALLNQVFGDYSDLRRDFGVLVGFVTLYSEANIFENFAEHYMYYVYYGDSFRSMMARQEQQFGSYLLGRKYAYISRLFYGLWFQGNGVVGGWPGFPI